MMRHVDFVRSDPPEPLAGLVAFLWSVAWELPEGAIRRQDVLAHPAVNVSVGNGPPAGNAPPAGPHPVRMVVNGVSTGLTTRILRDSGWNLAVRTTTGGFGAWVDDVSAINDRVAAPSGLLGLDEAAVARQVAEAGLADGRQLLCEAMLAALKPRPRRRIETARDVARVAAAAERSRSIVRVDQLASLAGVTARTLQRTFLSYAGVPPMWVIRRYRLLDAVEEARDGTAVDWAGLAQRLGYSDQAHLTRDFTSTIGESPAAYCSRQQMPF
jgi:AraC-like DNA-binding protein